MRIHRYLVCGKFCDYILAVCPAKEIYRGREGYIVGWYSRKTSKLLPRTTRQISKKIYPTIETAQEDLDIQADRYNQRFYDTIEVDY